MGHRSPGSFKEFLKLNSIPEQIGALDEDSMITELVKGHEAISRKAREVINIAKGIRDEATVDLLSSRIEIHDRTARILSSFLKK